jgi:hypothetical protein
MVSDAIKPEDLVGKRKTHEDLRNTGAGNERRLS